MLWMRIPDEVRRSGLEKLIAKGEAKAAQLRGRSRAASESGSMKRPFASRWKRSIRFGR